MITLGPAEKPLTEQQRKEIERHLLQLSATPTASIGTKVHILQNCAIDAIRLYKELHRLALIPKSEDATALVVERDNLKKMLDDANAREEALIATLGEFKRRWPLVYEEIVEKPVPMCRPDPAADGSGS